MQLENSDSDSRYRRLRGRGYPSQQAQLRRWPDFGSPQGVITLVETDPNLPRENVVALLKKGKLAEVRCISFRAGVLLLQVRVFKRSLWREEIGQSHSLLPSARTLPESGAGLKGRSPNMVGFATSRRIRLVTPLRYPASTESTH